MAFIRPLLLPPGAARGRTRPRVLVVDDSALMRSVLTEVLTDAGVTVVGQAGHGEQALALLGGGLDADVVLLDYRMPGIDGITVARRIRQFAPDVAVVMLSASDDAAGAAALAGAAAFLAKGSPVDEVVAAIRRASAAAARRRRQRPAAN